MADRNNNNTECWQGCRQTRSFLPFQWVYKILHTAFLESVWQLLIKLNTHILYDPHILHLITTSTDNLSSHRGLYMNVYSDNWKRSKSQLVNEQIIHTMVYPHNGIILINEKEQTTDKPNNTMNLTCIMLSERSQSQKAT